MSFRLLVHRCVILTLEFNNILCPVPHPPGLVPTPLICLLSGQMCNKPSVGQPLGRPFCCLTAASNPVAHFVNLQISKFAVSGGYAGRRLPGPHGNRTSIQLFVGWWNAVNLQAATYWRAVLLCIISRCFCFCQPRIPASVSVFLVCGWDQARLLYSQVTLLMWIHWVKSTALSVNRRFHTAGSFFFPFSRNQNLFLEPVTFVGFTPQELGRRCISQKLLLTDIVGPVKLHGSSYISGWCGDWVFGKHVLDCSFSEAVLGLFLHSRLGTFCLDMNYCGGAYSDELADWISQEPALMWKCWENRQK